MYPLVFVTFNPPLSFYDQIKDLSLDFDIVVFCNCKLSFDRMVYLFSDFDNVSILGNGINIGLSRAFNVVLNHLSQKKFFILFDQDTVVGKFFKFAILNLKEEKLSNYIIVQLSSLANDNSKYNSNYYIKDRFFVINSGSILNVEKLVSIGGFSEEAFVDCVDYQLCLEAAIHNFKVGYHCGYFDLDHSSLQDDNLIIFFGKKIYFRKYPFSRYSEFNRRIIFLIFLSLKYFKFGHTSFLFKSFLSFNFKFFLSLFWFLYE